MKKRVGVAILGLGVVGGGTYRTLVDHREFYLKTQNVDIVVESVLDKNTQRLKELGVPDECIAGSIAEIVANPAIDIVIETIGGVGVAKEFVMMALKEGKTVVMVLHDLPTALKYADEIAVMCGGEMISCGTPDEIYNSSVLDRVFAVTIKKIQTDEGIHYYY